jgi:hypothetical protein
MDRYKGLKKEKLPMRVILLLLLLLLATHASAQESFKLPVNPRGIVVDYLRNMKVKDPSRRLNETEKHEISRLFVRAYVISVRRHRQDYSLSSGTPIYRLLVTNFPDVAAREGEGKSIIFLGAIAGFFNSLPEYRSDVLQVLRQGINATYCKPITTS